MSLTLPRPPDMRQLLGSARFSPLMMIVMGALGALALLAAAFAVYAAFAPEPEPPPRAATDWKAPLPAVVDLGEPSANADTQLLSRPIFSKDRRPAPKLARAAPSQPTGPVSDAPTGIKVNAIVKRRNDSRAFVVGVNGQGEWKTVGEKVDEWTISAIAPQELTLSNGVNMARLQLYSDKPVAEDPTLAQQRREMEEEKETVPPGPRPTAGSVPPPPPQNDPDAPPINEPQLDPARPSQDR